MRQQVGLRDGSSKKNQGLMFIGLYPFVSKEYNG